jgi:hypothetical protein
MGGRAPRFLTVLAVVGLCAPAVSRGWDIVRFSLADAGSGTEADRPWVNASGLAFSAQESLLTNAPDDGDQNGALKRSSELTDILSVRPLSSEYWLSLAEIRLVTNQPSSKVVEAFALSILTGTNEGYLIARRGVFGASHWEGLPLEVRKRTATDLAAALVFHGGATLLSDRIKAKLGIVLSKTTEEVRQNIQTILQAEGLSREGLASIGLGPNVTR